MAPGFPIPTYVGPRPYDQKKSYFQRIEFAFSVEEWQKLIPLARYRWRLLRSRITSSRNCDLQSEGMSFGREADG